LFFSSPSKIIDRVTKLKKKTIVTVNIWTVSSLTIIMFAQLPLYILLAANFSEKAVYYSQVIMIIWVVILTCLIGANLIVFLGVERINKLRIKSQIVVQSGMLRENLKLDKIIQRTQRTAVGIILLSIALCVTLPFLMLVFQRTVYSDPRCYVDTSFLAFRFSVTFWILLFLLGVWYIYPYLKFKLLAPSSTATPANGLPIGSSEFTRSGLPETARSEFDEGGVNAVTIV
jgi:hypothetical protein